MKANTCSGISQTHIPFEVSIIEQSRLCFWQRKRFYSLPDLWTASPLLNSYLERSANVWGLKLTTYLRLMPILRLSGAKLPFPQCIPGMKRHIFTYIYSVCVCVCVYARVCVCVCVCVCVWERERERERDREVSIVPNAKTTDISLICNFKHGSK
jgi:hypothetical protein